MCSARQLECAANARSCINTAVKLLKAGEGVDIISIELEQALANLLAIEGIELEQALANLLAIEGKNATDEMLDRLFENFCVGK